MSLFQLIGLVVSLVAVFGFLNHRFVKLPDTVGITAIGIVVSLAAVLLANRAPGVVRAVTDAIAHFDFASLLLDGVLGLLLFAGSLHIDAGEIAKEKWLILVLATFGVATSTVLVGGGFYLATSALGVTVPLLSCMLFGALISPTDPVAVLAVLRRVGVPKSLETRIAGESLFNDGTAVVVFLTLLGLARSGSTQVDAGETALLFATEVLGGALFGLVIGQIGFLLLRQVDSHPVEILITLALATGGYTLAEALHVSAPIAVVLMGLIVGNRAKREAMSKETERRLFEFWEVFDDLLNLLLFGLIGLEMLVLSFSWLNIVLAVIAIAIVLAARLASVGVPIGIAPRLAQHRRATITIMTWGGLRGGISIALALSLPVIAGREIIITTTYGVVVFSILVQALTLRRVAARALAAG